MINRFLDGTNTLETTPKINIDQPNLKSYDKKIVLKLICLNHFSSENARTRKAGLLKEIYQRPERFIMREVFRISAEGIQELFVNSHFLEEVFEAYRKATTISETTLQLVS